MLNERSVSLKGGNIFETTYIPKDSSFSKHLKDDEHKVEIPKLTQTVGSFLNSQIGGKAGEEASTLTQLARPIAKKAIIPNLIPGFSFGPLHS